MNEEVCQCRSQHQRAAWVNLVERIRRNAFVDGRGQRTRRLVRERGLSHEQRRQLYELERELAMHVVR